MSSQQPTTLHLTFGAMVPVFTLPLPDGAPFVFGNQGGRYNILSFMGSGADACRVLCEAFSPWFNLFDISTKYFIGLCGSADARAAVQHWHQDDQVVLLHDPNEIVRRLYQLPEQGYVTFVLDPALRVVEKIVTQNPADHACQVMEICARLRRTESVGLAVSTAPILMLDKVFDDDLIAAVKAEYDRIGGVHSGYMQTSPEGQTVETLNYDHKVRRDVLIESESLRAHCRAAIQRAIAPAIQRVFQFQVTRMERYLIGCYEVADENMPAGHFNRHRDNTTRGTAHRRFAVSIGLDADAYDGGDLCFPEFDQRHYRPSTGGAVIFSCSLLHEVRPVTRGRRMAFLPFLFDEAAEKIRLENMQYVTPKAA